MTNTAQRSALIMSTALVHPQVRKMMSDLEAACSNTKVSLGGAFCYAAWSLFSTSHLQAYTLSYKVSPLSDSVINITGTRIRMPDLLCSLSNEI